MISKAKSRDVVACYLRASSDRQKEDSHERQTKDCHDVCRRFDLPKPELWYAEKAGRSGLRRKGRDAFAQMIMDAEDGKFNILVLSETSRLAREKATRKLALLESLLDLGIRIFALDREVKTADIAGQIVELVKADAEVKESESIAIRSTSGKRSKWAEGDFLHALPPGYVKKFTHNGEVIHVSRYGDPPRQFVKGKGMKAHVEITDDKKELQAVREMFNTLAQGGNSVEACKILNDAGIRNKAGNEWVPLTVRRLAKRVAYIGLVQIGARSRSVFAKVEDEVQQMPGIIPAIIDRNTFDKAQATLERLAGGRGGPNIGRSMLAGLVVSEAGFPLYASEVDGILTYKEWVDPRRERPEGHKLSCIRASYLDGAVLKTLREFLGDPAAVEYLETRLVGVRRLNEAMDDTTDEELGKIGGMIETASRNLMLAEDPGVVAFINREIRNLKKRQSELRQQRKEKARNVQRTDEIQKALQSLPRLLDEPAGELCGVLKTFIDRIVVKRFGTGWNAVVEFSAGGQKVLEDKDLAPEMRCHQLADFITERGEVTRAEIIEFLGVKSFKNYIRTAQSRGRKIEELANGSYRSAEVRECMPV